MKAVILAASLLIAGAANAQSCETPADVMAQVLAVVPNAYVSETYSGDEAQVILKGYNEAPPPSDWRAERITVMHAPGFAHVLLIAHAGGCVVFKDQVPLPAFLSWVGRGA
jgi:hypothetical protein